MNQLQRILLGICACALLPRTSAAQDYKAYHGAICKPYYKQLMVGGNQVDTSTNNAGILNYWDALAHDPSGLLPAHYECPLIRDETGGSTLSWVVVEIENVELGSTPWVYCWLFSQNEDAGDLSDYYDYAFDDDNTTGVAQLEFVNLSTTTGNEGSYVVSCGLGPSDTLRHVLVQE